jgi:Ca2+-binding RTX toxin-like protein
VIDGGADNDNLYYYTDYVNGAYVPATVSGGDGNDWLDSGASNDSLAGGAGNDELDGGAGNDRLDGGMDDDSLVGGAGNDTLIGGQGADSMAGGNDRDVFLVTVQGHGLNDVIDGNEGGDDFDTLDLRGSGPLSIVYDPTNPENGTVTFLDADRNPTGTLAFTNIENVVPCFTPGTLIATPKGDVRLAASVVVTKNVVSSARTAPLPASAM